MIQNKEFARLDCNFLKTYDTYLVEKYFSRLISWFPMNDSISALTVHCFRKFLKSEISKLILCQGTSIQPRRRPRKHFPEGQGPAQQNIVSLMTEHSSTVEVEVAHNYCNCETTGKL